MQPVAPPPDTPGKPLVPATLGIRHFSPASARALGALLETVRPQCILLEAPADASVALKRLGAAPNVPPLGLLGVGPDADGERFLYPLAAASPEWLAVSWASRHDCELVGIDLSGAEQLALAARLRERPEPGRSAPPDPHAAFAQRAGAPDFDVWWERHLEHVHDPDRYASVVRALGDGLREQPWDERLHIEWQLRESFMRGRILEVLARGVPPERCVVVCGAIHVPALVSGGPDSADLSPAPGAASAESASSLHQGPDRRPPRAPQALPSLSWHPMVLSAQRMAAAGHPAPAYFELLARSDANASFEAPGVRFLSEVAERLRAVGGAVSPAEVIEAQRLATALAMLADAPVATLRDLEDAARTVFANVGDSALLDTALTAAAVGEGHGRLEGQRPMIALEFELRLDELGLTRPSPGGQRELVLDLRPGAGDASDLERSILFHRLHALELPGIGLLLDPELKAGSASTERWSVAWTPDLESSLFEAGLLADTLREAALLRLRQRLSRTRSVPELATLLLKARACALPDVFLEATERLNSADLRATTLSHQVRALRALSQAAETPARSEGDVSLELGPVLSALLRATVRTIPLLPELPSAARSEAEALRMLVQLAVRVGGSDRELDATLRTLATGLKGRPRLRGAALALVLETQRAPPPQLGSLLSTRLGGADLRDTSAFLEGLLHHDARALLALTPLWEALDAWVQQASPSAFARGLIPLRRAFSGWAPDARQALQARVLEGLGHQDLRAASPAPRLPHDAALARALERLDGLEL